MSNDKTTLANVQPGGRVRPGDQALSTSEGARQYVADFFATQLRRHDFRNYITTKLAADFACALAQYLAFLPSPTDEHPDIASWSKGYNSGYARALADHVARQPVGRITDTEIDARLNGLYRQMVDSGQHNGGMSGVAWDRAVYRTASGSPEQAVDLAAAIKAAFPLLTDYGLHHSQCCAYKLIDERHRLHNFIDRQAVGNG